MTLEALYRCGRRELAEAGVDSPAFDTMALFTRRFGLDRQALLLHGEQEAEKEKAEVYLADVRERAAGRFLRRLLAQPVPQGAPPHALPPQFRARWQYTVHGKEAPHG